MVTITLLLQFHNAIDYLLVVYHACLVEYGYFITVQQAAWYPDAGVVGQM